MITEYLHLVPVDTIVYLESEPNTPVEYRGLNEDNLCVCHCKGHTILVEPGTVVQFEGHNPTSLCVVAS